MKQDANLSATLEERRMGFDAICQHLEFTAVLATNRVKPGAGDGLGGIVLAAIEELV